MKYNPKKFINCIIFFAQNTNPKKLGILKLNKLLYYMDFKHYREYGRPILGDIYIKMQHGPVPSFSYNLFQAFRNREDGKIIQKLGDSIELKSLKVKDLYIEAIFPKREFDKSIFSASELEIMTKVAKKYSQDTGSAMSRKTHKADTPWSKTPEMQTVDYDSALEDKGRSSISKKYSNHWQKQEEELEILFA